MDGAHHRQVFQRHLGRAVGADRHAGVGAAEAQVGAGDRRHADEVVGAAQEGGEGGGEGYIVAHLHADRGGDQLLFGDEHLEEAIGIGLAEVSAKVELLTSASNTTRSPRAAPSAWSASP